MKVRTIYGLLLTPILLVSSHLDGATRLTYDIGGTPKPIEWRVDSIQLQVDRSSFGDAASQGAIERSFAAWQDVERGNVRFSPTSVSAARPGADGKSLITSIDSFYANSGFLAFTTAWFDDDGVITEADIQIDRELARTALEPLLTHELGHLLGLDHSGVISSIMFPFVDTKSSLRLEQDDRIAVRQIYPSSAAKPDGAFIEGTVENSHSSIWGAQVVLMDELGSVHATTLTSANGRYRLGPTDPGVYRVYVEPMDGPVTRRNFSGEWLKVPAEVFNTTFGQQSLTLANGETRRLDLRIIESPVSLNPKWIGIVETGAGEMSLNSMGVSVRAGDRINLAIGGDGFISGLTTFEFPSGKIRRVSDYNYGSSWVWATFEIDADVPDSAVSILVNSGTEKAALTGGLRVLGTDAQPRRRGTGRG